MKFALLSESELRLVDLMFDAGVFEEVPVVVGPPAERGAASTPVRALASAARRLEATARGAGGVLAHGSIDELMRLAEQGRASRHGHGRSPRT